MSGGGCPAPDTMILMWDHSQTAAGELKVNDRVYTMHEKTGDFGIFSVTAVNIIEQEMAIVEFTDNSKLKVSLTHKFFMFSEQWKETTELAAGDIVKGLKVNKTVDSITNIGVGPAIKITVDQAHTFISEGIISHNKVPINPGDCFIGNSLISMADGTVKKIMDVQIGDDVFNYDKTSCNKVKFIEQVTGNIWEYLYTPTNNYEPFATINHPLYINGVLSSVDPVSSYKIHPWLGKFEKIESPKIMHTNKTYNEQLYNLWIDGDGTYIVNDFGTTSIVGNSGMFKTIIKCIDDGLITVEKMNKVIERHSRASINNPNLMIGLYVLGEFLIKLNNKNLFKLLVKLQPKKDTDEMRLPLKLFLLTLGFICSKTKWKK